MYRETFSDHPHGKSVSAIDKTHAPCVSLAWKTTGKSFSINSIHFAFFHVFPFEFMHQIQTPIRMFLASLFLKKKFRWKLDGMFRIVKLRKINKTNQSRG